MPYTRQREADPIAKGIYKIKKLKKALNSILECGAYSEKNFELQMNKKSSNYNEEEIFFAELIKEKRKEEALKIRTEIIKDIEKDKCFFEYLKNENPSLYSRLELIIKERNNEHAKN